MVLPYEFFVYSERSRILRRTPTISRMAGRRCIPVFVEDGHVNQVGLAGDRDRPIDSNCEFLRKVVRPAHSHGFPRDHYHSQQAEVGSN